MRVEGASPQAVNRQDPAEQRVATEAAGTGAAAPAASPQAAARPGQTLAEMARQGPQLHSVAAQGPSRQPAAGEPSFGAQVRGTTQRPIDLRLAQMANDVYHTPNAAGQTETRSEKELAQAGWNRVQPGDTLSTPDGRTVRLDAAQLNEPSSGFDAAVYQNDKGNVVVAFAGTNPKSPPDLVADAGQGLGLENRQYEMAASLGVKMAGIFGTENVAFTGHSLGGGLAAAATLASGAQGVTFNAAGLSNETLREYGSPNSLRADYATNGALRSFSVAGDPLTVVGHAGTPHPIGTELQTPNLTDTRNPITMHGGGGDNELFIDGLRQAQAAPAPTALLTDRLTEQKRQAELNTLGTMADFGTGLFGDSQRIGTDTTRDLIGAVRQPDGFTQSRVVSELADGGLQLSGAAADRTLEGLGRETTVLTDAVGQGTRELLRGTPWEARSAEFATRVESSGEVMRGALDAAGDNARAVTDLTGKLVSGVPDWSKDATTTAVEGGAEVAATAWAGTQQVAQTTAREGQAVASATAASAQDVTRSAVDGGVAIASTSVDALVATTRSAASGIGRVTSVAGQEARDGARALAQGDFMQAARTVAEAPAKLTHAAAAEASRVAGVAANEAKAVTSTISKKVSAVAHQAAKGAAAVTSSVVHAASQVADSVVRGGQAVMSTVIQKAAELGAKLNPFKWSF